MNKKLLGIGIAAAGFIIGCGTFYIWKKGYFINIKPALGGIPAMKILYRKHRGEYNNMNLVYEEVVKKADELGI